MSIDALFAKWKDLYLREYLSYVRFHITPFVSREDATYRFVDRLESILTIVLLIRDDQFIGKLLKEYEKHLTSIGKI